MHIFEWKPALNEIYVYNWSKTYQIQFTLYIVIQKRSH